MTHDHSHSEEIASLSIEIRKMEVRIADFLEHEDAFIAELQNFMSALKDLQEAMSHTEESLDAEAATQLKQLKLKVAEEFNHALKACSKAEHEKSHLLESYGATILSLEHEFQYLFSKSHSQE
jgi:adenylosuccinate synthase